MEILPQHSVRNTSNPALIKENTMKYEYVPFTSYREVNRALLCEGLRDALPDWVGAVPKNDMLDEMVAVLKNDDLFLSSAELYADGSANIYVKQAFGTPAIGFIRVRPEGVVT